MTFERALKIAIEVLKRERRKYAPEARGYELSNFPEFKSQWQAWKKLDDAIKVLECEL